MKTEGEAEKGRPCGRVFPFLSGQRKDRFNHNSCSISSHCFPHPVPLAEVITTAILLSSCPGDKGREIRDSFSTSSLSHYPFRFLSFYLFLYDQRQHPQSFFNSWQEVASTYFSFLVLFLNTSLKNLKLRMISCNVVCSYLAPSAG